MKTVGFTQDEVIAIVRIVLAVLELGRVCFDETDPDVSAVRDAEVIRVGILIIWSKFVY